MPAHLILFDLFVSVIFGEEHSLFLVGLKLWVQHYPKYVYVKLYFNIFANFHEKKLCCWLHTVNFISGVYTFRSKF